jgi:TadE-like protein
VVEAVLIIPLLMILLMVIVQLVVWAHASQVAQLAASEGDRTARSLGGGMPAGISQAQFVLGESGSSLQSSHVTGTVLSGGQAEITVTGRAITIVPGFKLSVSSVQVGTVQEFRPSE